MRAEGEEVVSQPTKVLFETEFVEIEAIATGYGLEETILEVVEVEEDIRLVHRLLGVADGEIEVLSAEDLNAGKLRDGAPQEVALSIAVSATSLASRTQSIEERTRTEVFLQVATLIGRDREDARHREPFRSEMTGEGDEGVILFYRSSDNTYHALTLGRCKTKVLTIAA